ncbi:hypothetical protein [Streptomyces sp. 1222.5]|uniref:hypothetical protein n=1 Tax=Streptomyces sp. 1222.5 TaxID=1881026 RepID=UPI003D71C272
MTGKPFTRTKVATVRPWHSLASLGVIESDLTHTRFRTGQAPHDTEDRPGPTHRPSRHEEA